MPNWCNNVLEISHTDAGMMKRVKESYAKGELLNEFIPVPKALQIIAGRAGADDNPDQIALVEAEKSNREKYGYANWYDYCVNEWGTKWDISPYENITETSDGLVLGFDTAWSPPVKAYEKLLDLGFTIRAYYYEPGMGYAGVWEDGFDEEYTLEGSADDVEAEIPEALDEMFNITENMRLWEEENGEEE